LSEPEGTETLKPSIWPEPLPERDWASYLVRIAHRWGAKRLDFSRSENSLRVELQGLEFGEVLSGRVASWPDDLLALLSTLFDSVCESAVVAEQTRAVRITRDSVKWGGAKLEANSFLIQFEPGEAVSDILTRLRSQVNCDKLEVVCNGLIPAFWPDSVVTRLGVWAVLTKDGEGIPLGRTFASLGPDGVERNEIGDLTFRKGVVGAGAREFASTVAVFSRFERPRTSLAVELADGVEVSRTELGWAPQNVSVTLFYTESSELGDDLRVTLERMVEEYNAYQPSLGSGTLGCWFLVALFGFGAGGLMAPMTGSMTAGVIGFFCSLFLLLADWRNRREARYRVGRGLEILVEESSKTPPTLADSP